MIYLIVIYVIGFFVSDKIPASNTKYWLKKMFYHPVMRVKRFIDYASIIWEDDDYDKGYIYIMLKYKISRTREHLADHKMRSDWQKVCDEMKEAEDIIERIMKEDYLQAEQDAYHEKYPLNFKDDENGESYVESTHDKPQGAEWRTLRERMLEMERQDEIRLGYLLTTSIKDWWD